MRDLARRLSGRGRNGQAAPPRVLQPLKLRAIDACFERLGARSFADLGGVWAVNGGYTFHGLGHPGIERATLVDTGINDAVRDRARHEPRLRLLDGNFGDPEMPGRVGEVDAVLLFDVLLHQVDPDWDEIVRRWAPYTKAFVIVQPHLVEGESTVRLVELGKDRYDTLVPAVPVHDEAWSKLDEIHEGYGKRWRDIHEIWQWGIVDADLDRLCRGLGFELIHYEDAGRWMTTPAFEHHAFVYVKDRQPAGARAVRSPGWPGSDW